MINPNLERRYADCSELVDAWKAYLEQFNRAVLNTETAVSPELEQRFMDIKARIAMLHDSFMEALRHDQNVGQNMLSIVNRSITLRHLRKLGTADKKKIEIEWHECYLLLNETVSTIGEERERLGEINELNWRIQKIRERIRVNTVAFLRSIYFKIIVALAILAAILIVPTWFGWDWDRLRAMDHIGEPYSAFLDFKRETLGMDAPYGDLEKFDSIYIGKLPSGYTATPQDSMKLDTTASVFNSITIDGQKGAEFLKQATEFKAFQMSLPDNKPPVLIYIFYFFEKGPAPSFTHAFNSQITNQSNPMAQALGANYTALYDQNVLVIIGGSYIDLRQQVKRDVFKKQSF